MVRIDTQFVTMVTTNLRKNSVLTEFFSCCDGCCVIFVWLKKKALDNFIFVALKFCENKICNANFLFMTWVKKTTAKKQQLLPSVEKVVKKCSHFLLFAFSHE